MRESSLERFAAGVGRRLREALAGLGSIAWLVYQTLLRAGNLRHEQFGVVSGVVRLQVRFTALDALPLAGFTALLLGGITLLQVYGSWAELGAETFLSKLLAHLVIRELGPLLVGVIVISRSGTAIATEMATMKLNGEVDTLFATGVNPLSYLLVPRILGGMISVFCLIVFFDTVALLGGFLLAYTFMPISFHAFMTALNGAIHYQELWITLCKSLAFGAAIPLLCMHAGLRVERSTTEIPQAVTRAAVASLVTLFVSGAFLSAVFYV
jgi:phospholipid/cholesterol/gamma-HCH transport system permease protein